MPLESELIVHVIAPVPPSAGVMQVHPAGTLIEVELKVV